MKGKILDFNLQASEGVISGIDGNRYAFVSAEWKTSDVHPRKDLSVDFVANNGIATAIYAEAQTIPGSAEVQEFLKQDNIFTRYYIGVLKNYAKFEGRARREEFWYFLLFNFIVGIILSIISATVLYPIYALATIVPHIALAARRLHDTNRSGWWQLLAIIPLIGIIVLIVFYVQDSEKGDNRFGSNPKA